LRHQLSSCEGDVCVLACFSHCFHISALCRSRKLIKRASDKKNEFRICVELARAIKQRQLKGSAAVAQRVSDGGVFYTVC
jgi:hypothetical protein